MLYNNEQLPNFFKKFPKSVTSLTRKVIYNLNAAFTNLKANKMDMVHKAIHEICNYPQVPNSCDTISKWILLILKSIGGEFCKNDEATDQFNKLCKIELSLSYSCKKCKSPNDTMHEMYCVTLC